jgi:hypothetical protein
MINVLIFFLAPFLLFLVPLIFKILLKSHNILSIPNTKFNNAFDVYNFIDNRFDGLTKKDSDVSNHINQMLSIYKSVKKSIYMYSGELYPYAKNTEFCSEFIKIIKSNANIKLNIVCGDVIACIRDKNDGELYNPLLRAIENKEINATIYYNHVKLEEQIIKNYFHSVVIDDGKRIMVEMPHDYDTHSAPNPDILRRLYFNNCKNVATYINSLFANYISENKLTVVDDFKKANWKLTYCDDLEGISNGNLEALIKNKVHTE